MTELAYVAEVWRKLLHLFALVMPIGYFLAGTHIAIPIIALAFLVSLLVDCARLRGWTIQRLWRRWVDPIVRPREIRAFTGATFILLSAWLCPLFLDLRAAAAGMTIIILGDTAAALVGRRWGRHRYSGNRSFEGSLAFLGAALIAVWAVPGIPVVIGVIAAVTATVVEGLSTRIDDNLSVPVISGLLIHLLTRIA
ncbi:MAG TPA: SEC59/DGK1/VTE5 family protein [candidate division Zixibacteria bacterium]|nr:SEC59/DGK1/VTE5 family protein [candidate division Zixibacteria bacterium]